MWRPEQYGVCDEPGTFSQTYGRIRTVILHINDVPCCWTTRKANNATAIIADSVHYPRLRLFTVKNPGGNALAADVNVSTNYTWGIASPATVGGPAFGWFSAVCFLYGRDLYTSLKGDVPIGLVASNVGGTFIQLWSSGDALAACSSESETGSLTAAETAAAAAEPAEVEPFRANGGMLAGGALWNTMIVPLLPMAVRGAIWYQGEANDGDPIGYACQQRALIADWQAKFGWRSPGFHFSFVELAPGPGAQVAQRRTFLTSYLRTSQLASLDMPNVSYASAADKGDPFSPNGWWHPRYKQPVRLLLLRQPTLFSALPFQRESPFKSLASVCIGRCVIAGGREARCCDFTRRVRSERTDCERAVPHTGHADDHAWGWNCDSWVPAPLRMILLSTDRCCIQIMCTLS